ncbi:hypothetical protein DPMN_000867 [Dreissena polymorpha]|uniref:Uncharacterized protein n=1 Tax=Dreissena polymorpha TaxID=45954 RepID=A0A9D4MI89_DREPO|nr:hypothetical protein DPMN_000867 [Dreissena polymorpha]
MNRDSVGLGELPASPDVDDVMYDVVTVVVYERQRSSLVGNGQGELVVIHKTHLQMDTEQLELGGKHKYFP